MKKLKILFYANSGKINPKTKMLPIYMRVSKGSTKTEASLGLFITDVEAAYWNVFLQRLEIPDNSINKKLEEIADAFKGLKYLFGDTYDNFTPLEVKAKLLKKDTKIVEDEKFSAKNYIQKHFDGVILKSSSFSNGTVRNYRKSIKHFNNYLNYIKKESVKLEEFNSQMAWGFYDYLQNEIVELKKRSMSDVSASCVLIKIKAIFQRAVDSDIIRKNPFKNVKLQTKSPKRAELNIEEIKSIIELNLTEEPKLDVYRDLFLFSVFTGLAYCDVSSLRKGDILQQNEGYILCNLRVKSKEEFKQILVAPAVNLIKKYEDNIEVLPEGRIFPKRHLNNLNDALKLIRAKLGITKKLSSYIARHTCCQLLAEVGSINLDIINSIMGWSNSRQGTRVKYYRITIAMLVDAKIKIENFLNEKLCLR